MIPIHATDKKEIVNTDDIKMLVNSFYEKVLNDEILAPFFVPAASHWDAHLEIMYGFWENILFFTGNYSGNPMEKHRPRNSIQTLKAYHFDKWLQHFNATVDDLFIGEKADLAKQRAYSIAVVMKLKILSF